jgi:putative polyhydroxyalkanoate system protein
MRARCARAPAAERHARDPGEAQAMSTIELKRDHALGLKKAKAAAQRVADEMEREFGMDCEWDGNVLRFQRTGVSGELVVQRAHVEVHAKLGFLLAAFKGRIEETIHRNFDEYFG